MKKLIFCLLIALTLSLICVSVYAENDPAYVIENKTVNSGDEFTMDVSIANNPGIVSARFQIVYDSEALTLESVTDSGLLNGFTTPPKTISSPYTLRWADSIAEENNTANGVVATLKFKAIGTTSTTVTITPVEARNVDLQKVSFASAAATVTITVAPTGINADPASVNLDLAGTTTQTVALSILPEGATGTITASTSNANVATATAAGVITAVGKGTATVTFGVQGTNFTKTVAVTVTCSHNMVEEAAADYLKTAGNCVEGAVYYKHCSICGEQSNDTFIGDKDLDNHKGPITTEGAFAASCTEPGFTGSQVCSACQVTISNGENILPLGHQAAEEWSHDEQAHWKVCTREGCGMVIGESEAHTAGDWEVVTPAEVGKPGVKHKVCKVCGFEMETAEIDALVDYTPSEAAKAEYKGDVAADVVIATTAAGKQLNAVKINGQAISSDLYSVDAEGKVTIKKEAFSTLSAGDAAVEIEFEGGVATATVAVTPATQANNNTGVPSTIVLWVIILVVAASGMASMIVFKKKESR